MFNKLDWLHCQCNCFNANNSYKSKKAATSLIFISLPKGSKTKNPIASPRRISQVAGWGSAAWSEPSASLLAYLSSLHWFAAATRQLHHGCWTDNRHREEWKLCSASAHVMSAYGRRKTSRRIQLMLLTLLILLTISQLQGLRRWGQHSITPSTPVALWSLFPHACYCSHRFQHAANAPTRTHTHTQLKLQATAFCHQQESEWHTGSEEQSASAVPLLTTLLRTCRSFSDLVPSADAWPNSIVCCGSVSWTKTLTTPFFVLYVFFTSTSRLEAKCIMFCGWFGPKKINQS